MANTKYCPVCGDRGTRNSITQHIRAAHANTKPRPQPSGQPTQAGGTK